jgi:hypothetical protein
LLAHRQKYLILRFLIHSRNRTSLLESLWFWPPGDVAEYCFELIELRQVNDPAGGLQFLVNHHQDYLRVHLLSPRQAIIVRNLPVVRHRPWNFRSYSFRILGYACVEAASAMAAASPARSRTLSSSWAAMYAAKAPRNWARPANGVSWRVGLGRRNFSYLLHAASRLDLSAAESSRECTASSA